MLEVYRGTRDTFPKREKTNFKYSFKKGIFMGKIVDFETWTDKPNMTMEEIIQLTDSIGQEVKEHPERFTPEARALIELGEEIERGGNSEFEIVRNEKRIRDVMKKVGHINLSGPEFNNKDWEDFHKKADMNIDIKPLF